MARVVVLPALIEAWGADRGALLSDRLLPRIAPVLCSSTGATLSAVALSTLLASRRRADVTRDAVSSFSGADVAALVVVPAKRRGRMFFRRRRVCDSIRRVICATRTQVLLGKYDAVRATGASPSSRTAVKEGRPARGSPRLVRRPLGPAVMSQSCGKNDSAPSRARPAPPVIGTTRRLHLRAGGTRAASRRTSRPSQRRCHRATRYSERPLDCPDTSAWVRLTGCSISSGFQRRASGPCRSGLAQIVVENQLVLEQLARWTPSPVSRSAGHRRRLGLCPTRQLSCYEEVNLVVATAEPYHRAASSSLEGAIPHLTTRGSPATTASKEGRSGPARSAGLPQGAGRTRYHGIETPMVAATEGGSNVFALDYFLTAGIPRPEPAVLQADDGRCIRARLRDRPSSAPSRTTPAPPRPVRVARRRAGVHRGPPP